jgi:hypothetical protein
VQFPNNKGMETLKQRSLEISGISQEFLSWLSYLNKKKQA